MKSVAKLIARHLENILIYLRIPITNAGSESVNSKIQWVKYQARGFRNEERFMRSILFHCGGLTLLPTHPIPEAPEYKATRRLFINRPWLVVYKKTVHTSRLKKLLRRQLIHDGPILKQQSSSEMLSKISQAMRNKH